ncbi:MAG: translation initiation factor IF-1 [Chthoniobacterales bacterium]|jgi:translation initiation factor IF-1
MPASDSLKHQALVVERLSMTRFRVELVGGRRMLATVSGRLRLKFTRIAPGHHVEISVSPYDLNQGTIIQRLPQSPSSTSP